MGKTNSNNSNNVDRKQTKGNQRSKSTIMRINMLNSGKLIRNKEGKVVGGFLAMNNTAGGQKIEGQARIAPDRRWFGNTRVIAQTELDSLREKVTAQSNDPYAFILRRKRIPMALLQESEKVAKMNLLETESFEDTFGKTNQRKRPKLTATDYASYMQEVEKKTAEAKDLTFEINTCTDLASSAAGGDDSGALDIARDDLFAKGQSKRIWGELYKVLDCSDVIIQVLDARNIPGTRSIHIEKHIKKNAAHKHLIFVLNKCDLIPSWATRKWVQTLSQSYPTVAFHSKKVEKSFGKGALINLLRQFSKLHADKRQISVGIIGYPNVGKSSIINALKGEKVCKTAPIPGETKVWQYVTLTKRIFLIDSPGVVYDVGDDEVEIVLKGVVRSERLKDPCDSIPRMLLRAKPVHFERLYGVPTSEAAMQAWATARQDFETRLGNNSSHEARGQLEKQLENDPATRTMSDNVLSLLGQRKGKLLPSGEVCLSTVAKMLINDWQRGKMPFFVPPPRATSDEDQNEDEEADDEDEDEEGDEEDDDNDAAELENLDEEEDDDEEEEGNDDDSEDGEEEDEEEDNDEE